MGNLTIKDDEAVTDALFDLAMLSDLFINADKSGVMLKGMTLVTMGKFISDCINSIRVATGIELCTD